MKITTITVLFVVVSCFFIVRSLLMLRRDEVGIRFTLMWTLMWGCIALQSIFPSFMDYFTEMAMMKNRMYFVLLTSLFILFSLVFDLLSRFERKQRDIAKLVQGQAILAYQVEQLSKALDTRQKPHILGNSSGNEHINTDSDQSD